MTTNNTTDDSVVTPWEVKGRIDYKKLVEHFGTELIDNGLIKRIERVTGKPAHPWIKRGIFFSHRSLHEFLDAYESGKPVFLYTGRGPTSDSMHIGHLIPFMFTKYLQDAFKCPLVIQIADDEKYYFRCKEYTEFEKIYKLGFENAKEIIACGFDPERTFIFSNRDYRLAVDQFEKLVSEFKHNVQFKQLKSIFGLDGSANIGMIDWPIYQSVAAFSESYPHLFSEQAYCLVPYAIDQDPYFRLLRDVAPKMGLLKNASIMCTFIPPLTGPGGKMSSSTGTDSTVFLSDDPDTIKAKIRKYAFSAGGDTLEDHKKYGGRPDEDISYQYLRYFEFDDDKLENVRSRFQSGDMSCGEIKDYLANTLASIIHEHQKNRATVTDETVTRFYSRTPMIYKNEYEKKEIDRYSYLMQFLDEADITTSTVTHEVVTTMEKAEELASTLGATICKNILLVDSKSKRYYLVVTNSNSAVDMKKMGVDLASKNLKFATEQQLKDILNVEKGQVSLLALINDTRKQVSVVLDEMLSKSNRLGFHPLVNDRTTIITYADTLKFLDMLSCRYILSSSFSRRDQVESLKFWDGVAKVYGQSNMTSTEADPELDIITREIVDGDITTLVGIGSADGVRDPEAILSHLNTSYPNKYEKIEKVVVTDYAPQMVEMAKKRLEKWDRKFEYASGSAHLLKFPSSHKSSLMMSVYNKTFIMQALALYLDNKDIIGKKVTLSAVSLDGVLYRQVSISFDLEQYKEYEQQILDMAKCDHFFAYLFTTDTGFISHYFDQDTLLLLLAGTMGGTITVYNPSTRHILYNVTNTENPDTVITMLNNVLGNIPDDIMIDSLVNIKNQFF